MGAMGGHDSIESPGSRSVCSVEVGADSLIADSGKSDSLVTDALRSSFDESSGSVVRSNADALKSDTVVTVSKTSGVGGSGGSSGGSPGGRQLVCVLRVAACVAR